MNKEEQIYNYLSFIADRIKDIQLTANHMKNPEDRKVIEQDLVKITDYIKEIRSGYMRIDLVEMEEDEE